MIELRFSEAAARSIVEQADYYREAVDDSLVVRWQKAVDAVIDSLLLSRKGAHCVASNLHHCQDCGGCSFPDFQSTWLFYRYFPQESAVLIVQVLHGSRNIDVMLGEDD